MNKLSIQPVAELSETQAASQSAFLKRGMRARVQAKPANRYASKNEVMVSLRSILNEAKRKRE